MENIIIIVTQFRLLIRPSAFGAQAHTLVSRMMEMKFGILILGQMPPDFFSHFDLELFSGYTLSLSLSEHDKSVSDRQYS